MKGINSRFWNKKRVVQLLPVVGIIFILLILYYPMLLGKSLVSGGMIFSDFWQFNFPLKEFYKQELASGRIGLWTSLLGNGFPVFAEGQIGALYPLNLFLFSLFPVALAFNLDILIHYFLAFAFTYLFSRVSLKLSKMASFFAGMCFTLCGYMFFHVMFLNLLIVVSYLPLLMLLIERIYQKPALKYFFFLTLTLILIILAGHLELGYYVVASGVLFFLLLSLFARNTHEDTKGKISSLEKSRIKKTRVSKNSLFWRGLVIILMSGIFAVGVSSVQILPTYELYKNSNRGESYDLNYATSSRWPLSTLAMFVNPSLYDKYSQRIVNILDENNFSASSLYGYVGILPLFLAGYLIIGKKNKFAYIFLILLALSLIYGIGRSTQFFSIIWSIVPGMKSLRFPVKIMFLVEFCLAVLAGMGLDRFAELIKSKTKLNVQIVTILVVTISFIDLYINNALRFRQFLNLNSWLAPPPSTEFLKNNLQNGQYRYFATNTNNLYQKKLDVSAQKSYQNLLPVNFNLLFNLPSNREYFTLFDEKNNKLNAFTAAPNFNTRELVFDERFYKSLQVQSVKYILTDFKIQSEDVKLTTDFPITGETLHKFYLKTADLRTELVPVDKVYAYEVKNAAPRVNLVDRYILVDSDQQALEKILDPKFKAANEVVLDKVDAKVANLSLSNQVGTPDGIGKVESIDNTQNSLEIQVNASDDSLLVVSDTYYPGWKVFVDGIQQPILKVNYSFRAVKVPSGKHNVRFVYEPDSVNLGIKISLGVMVIWILILAYYWLKVRPVK